VTIKLDLTEKGLRPMTLQGTDEDGDDLEIRFTFKKRLTRQQSMTMTKTLGKGKKAKEVPDLVRLYTQTIGSIELKKGFELTFQGEPLPMNVPIEDGMTIVAIMDNLPQSITEEVDSHILGSTELEVEEKNS
jgi:hypothetical protein